MIRALRERFRFAVFCNVHLRSQRGQERWQAKELRRLLNHALERVPVWRPLFERAGVIPDNIRSLKDLSALPITDKSMYVGKAVEEYIDRKRPASAAWYVTSGTSGMPLTFLMSERANTPAYNDFASLRFLWWRGYPIHAIARMRMTRIKIRSPQAPNRFFIPVELFLTDAREALRRIVDFRTEILSAYPSILLDMVRQLERDGSLPHPNPRFVLSFGEALAPSVRSLVSEKLGCEVYDRYGLEEIGAIGVECVAHDGFHINTESVIIEILDERGEAVPDGTEGRVVATDLLNFNMPFIRYDTGDRGRVSREECACGLRSPRIWVDGRHTAFLEMPVRRVHHLELDGAMDGFMHSIVQYQIAKRSDREIVARIVPGPAYAQNVVSRVREKLVALLGDAVEVRVEVVESIPLTPRGKCKILVDESARSKR